MPVLAKFCPVQTDILKELRKEKALTQAAIGKYFNISGAMYSMYETNKRPMSIYMLCRLADLLETSTDYILGRTDDPRPPHPRKHYNIKEQKKMNRFFLIQSSICEPRRLSIIQKETGIHEKNDSFFLAHSAPHITAIGFCFCIRNAAGQ